MSKAKHFFADGDRLVKEWLGFTGTTHFV
jgi:hypothetical protein